MTSSNKNQIRPTVKQSTFYLFVPIFFLLVSCQKELPKPQIMALVPEKAAQIAKEIREKVPAKIIDELELSLWASDSLVQDPIALCTDYKGQIYITRSDRMNHSEFDIRGHQDWMTASISFQSVEDRRNFLQKTFEPIKSDENEWLEDLNKDKVHDWRDLRVETEQIFRLKDRDGDGVADFSQVFIDDFHTEVTDVAEALLVYEDDVFVGVAPDLWRLKDKNGDGIADYKKSISHGYQVHIGFGGHGMSGLTMGPDGKIYWAIGDIGLNVVDQTGKRWKYPNQGAILRANPDGSDFEVFAAGLRNTHEFVFDEFGNLFSVDNDGDHPGEKERMVYIVNGSDSGWRTNWQFGKYTDPDNNKYKVWMDEEMFKPRFEGQAAYITPCIRNYHSGPTGLVYNPGTALSPKWKNYFFMSEFTGTPARSHIYAYQLKPKGATFEFDNEKKILSGILSTGIDFGHDGALYVADWIEGWSPNQQGRIWKLDDPTQKENKLRLETKTLLEANFKKEKNEKLGQLLAHVDMRVRQKAQFELVKRGQKGFKIFQKTAQNSKDLLARIHGLWGIAQMARKNKKYATALTDFLADENTEIKAQAAKLIGDIRYARPADKLIPLLKDASARVRFFAAEALGRIGHQPAILPIIKMLNANNDKDAYLRHAGVCALARIGGEAAMAMMDLANHSSRSLRIAAVVALRRMQHEGVALFLNDKDDFIVTEAARAINDDYSIKKALPALAEVLKVKRFSEEALLRRAINANLRVGKKANIQLLMDFAQRQAAPTEMRVEALQTLGVWAKPSVLDRVDGRFRGVIERDSTLIRKAVAPIVERLLTDENDTIQVATAHMVGRLKLKMAAPTLMAKVTNHPNTVVRMAALEALAKLAYPKMENALEIALNSTEATLRTSALRLVEASTLAPKNKVKLFRFVLGRSSVPEQQAAIVALGSLPTQYALEPLHQLLQKLTKGQLATGLELELTEAIKNGQSQLLQEKLQQYLAARNKNSLAASYSDIMDGGNPATGRDIFYQHQGAQCVRCHAIGDWGGDVGPKLTGIGKKLSKLQLLEALIQPSASIAPGYGVVTLTYNNGQTDVGTLKEETATYIMLEKGGIEPHRIPKSKIKSKVTAASGMPSMETVLKRRELRDMVAYLSSLR